MAVEPIDMGVAKTTALPNRGITGVSSSAAGVLKTAAGLSPYNLPQITRVNTSGMEQASRQQADLIRRAQERWAQLVAESEQPLAPGQTRPGPVARFAGESAAYFASRFGEGAAAFFGQTGENIQGIPGGPISEVTGAVNRKIEEVGTGLAQEFRGAVSGVKQGLSPLVQFAPETREPQKGPNLPGFSQQPMYDQYGNVTGYEYIRDTPVGAPQSIGMGGALGNKFDLESDAADIARMKERLTIDEQISILQKTAPERYENEVRRVWGTPKVEYIDPNNPALGVKSMAYPAAYGKDYIGLTPGEVKMVAVPELPADATMEQKQEYLRKLRTQIRPPKYTYTGLSRQMFTMSEEDIKSMQRKFLAARLYDPKTPVTFGLLTNDDKEILANLMEIGNINGTTWEFILDQRINDVKQNPGRYGTGGGGGGGGGGSSVYTQVNYSQTSVAQGRDLLTRVLQDALGRNPTESELSDFISMLNAAEKQSPSTMVTKTYTKKGATRSVSTQTPSTVDPAQMALEFAKQIGGGDEYRTNMAQMYMNWITERLGYGFGQG